MKSAGWMCYGVQGVLQGEGEGQEPGRLPEAAREAADGRRSSRISRQALHTDYYQ